MAEGATRICQAEGCETPFAPRKHWQRFCSGTCRKAHHDAEKEADIIRRYLADMGRRGGHARAAKLRRMGQRKE